MNQQHILHVTYDMNIGGTEQVIKNLIGGLDTTRFKSSILCIDGQIGPWGKDLQKQGIDVYCLNRQPGFDVKLIRAIRKLIKQRGFDILHCHQYTPWSYGAMAAALTNRKVIFTEHGRFYPDSSTLKRKLINPLLALMTDHITAISKSTKQALIEFENLPGNRIEVIYNGIRPQQPDQENAKRIRQQLDIPEGHAILGTIARLDPIKNHKMMLEAFKLVIQQHPNTVLIIVGDGPERDNIGQLIKLLGLTNKVYLPGYITNPTDYLASFDMYLLSSLSEGTSMTLLEAMSQGKPCVVTDAGGNPEIIAENNNGLVTANDDSQAFADAILKLLSTQNLLKQMGLKARHRFAELFTSNAMASSYQLLYSGALS